MAAQAVEQIRKAELEAEEIEKAAERQKVDRLQEAKRHADAFVNSAVSQAREEALAAVQQARREADEEGRSLSAQTGDSLAQLRRQAGPKREEARAAILSCVFGG